MRKLVLFGMLLLFSAGCGRSWSPFNRGASCKGGSCLGGAPALPPASGCNGCASSSAGYGSYDGEVSGYSGDIISSYDGGYSSPVVTSGVYGSGVPSGTITNPPMSTLPSP